MRAAVVHDRRMQLHARVLATALLGTLLVQASCAFLDVF